MRKAWRFVSALALIFLILGVACLGVGFFTGSSPVVIQNHGSLPEYIARLETNWDILRQNVTDFLGSLGL